MRDYYGEDGCCLTCEDSYDGCLCFDCKCKKCEWYEADTDYSGHCEYGQYHPPRGYVKTQIQCDTIVAAVRPVLNKSDFDTAIKILKENDFKYVPGRKVWYKRTFPPEDIGESFKKLKKAFDERKVILRACRLEKDEGVTANQRFNF